MQYKEAVEFIMTKLPYFQRQGSAAYKASLENIIELDAITKHAHKTFKTIHVAGTNGKGSVSHLLASILQEQGYKTGLFTSPHLIDFRERIKINGEMITENFVSNFVSDHFEKLQTLQPSFFEISVALAFDYFAKEKIDIAVIEVGLGGRLDATNIISPLVSVITNISLDHTDILGNSRELIAKEKAGIIKHKTPIVIGEKHKETAALFIEKARECDSEIFFADDTNFPEYECELKGIYQKKNKATVLQTIAIIQKTLNINQTAIETGIAKVVTNTGLMGRWQTISIMPRILCDTGHNYAGIHEITEQLKTESYNKLHIVWGMVKGKDYQSIISLLPKDAKYYVTQPNIERAQSGKELLAFFENESLNAQYFETIEKSLQSAKKNYEHNDLIFIGGSTFTVAEAIFFQNKLQ